MVAVVLACGCVSILRSISYWRLSNYGSRVLYAFWRVRVLLLLLVAVPQDRVVSGVGNWVADEVCFQACVHPGAACNTLSTNQVRRLLYAEHLAIRHTYHARPTRSVL